MSSIGAGDCFSHYWYIWTANGAASGAALIVNMLVSMLLCKVFQFASSPPSLPKKNPLQGFDQYRQSSPPPNNAWANDSTMGNAFDMT